MILGTSRLTTCIRAIALQGLLLGALPPALTQRWSLHIAALAIGSAIVRSEEHTSELQSHLNLVCRLLLEKKKRKRTGLGSTFRDSNRDSCEPPMAEETLY